MTDGIRNDAAPSSRAANPGVLANSRPAPSIEDMLRQVPEGEARLFERSSTGHAEERFFSVWQNTAQYPHSGRIEWNNTVGLENNPWCGSRRAPRIPVSSVPTPDVTIKRSAKALVDFYSTGSHAFFLSERLVALIERLDPGSLEWRHVTIRASKGVEVPFFMAMPNRNLSAVDTRRTDVLIKDENHAGEWLRSVGFPNGVSFRNEALTDASSFTDFDVSGWFWSKELIEAARAEGIKGLRTVSVAAAAERTVERL